MHSTEQGVVAPTAAEPRHDASGAEQAQPLLAVGRLLCSLPALTVLFFAVTALAAGPLRPVDVFLYQPWSDWILPTWRPFFQQVIDPIAGQAVALPILSAVALTLAWRRRSWLPIVTGAAAEFGFLGIVGTLKLVFARPAPILQDPDFFSGGVFDAGWHGISYPSGHAAEAVLLYGAAVLLIARYSSARRWVVAVLSGGVAFFTVLAAGTSFYLGWHWMTDLVGGMALGALVLRLVAVIDEHLPNWLRRLVRNRFHGLRQVMTAAGMVPVQQPRVNDERIAPATGERTRSSSASLVGEENRPAGSPDTRRRDARVTGARWVRRPNPGRRPLRRERRTRPGA